MTNLTFGIPTQRRAASTREAIVEKYPNTPVLTIHPVPVEQGKYFKMNLNKAALTALDLVNEEGEVSTVSLAFQEREIFMGKTPEGETNFLKVHKNGNIANKPYYQYIRRMLEVPAGEIECELILQENGFYALEVLSTDVEANLASTEEETVISDEEGDNQAYAEAAQIEASELPFDVVEEVTTEEAKVSWS